MPSHDALEEGDKCDFCDVRVDDLADHEAQCGAITLLRRLPVDADWSTTVFAMVADDVYRPVALRFVRTQWMRSRAWTSSLPLRRLFLRLPVSVALVRAWCDWYLESDPAEETSFFTVVDPLLARPEAADVIVVQLRERAVEAVVRLLESGRAPDSPAALRRWEARSPGSLGPIVGDALRVAVAAPKKEEWLDLWLDMGAAGLHARWTDSEVRNVAAALDAHRCARLLERCGSAGIAMWRELHPAPFGAAPDLTFVVARMTCRAFSMEEIAAAILPHSSDDPRWERPGPRGNLAYALAEVRTPIPQAVADWFVRFPPAAALPLAVASAVVAVRMVDLDALRDAVLCHDFALVVAHRSLGAYGYDWKKSWLAYLTVYVRCGGLAETLWVERRHRRHTRAGDLVATVVMMRARLEPAVVAAAAVALLPTNAPAADWALMRCIAPYHALYPAMASALAVGGPGLMDDAADAAVVQRLAAVAPDDVRRWIRRWPPCLWTAERRAALPEFFVA